MSHTYCRHFVGVARVVIPAAERDNPRNGLYANLPVLTLPVLRANISRDWRSYLQNSYRGIMKFIVTGAAGFIGKDLEQNTIATHNVLEAMRANGIKRIALEACV